MLCNLCKPSLRQTQSPRLRLTKPWVSSHITLAHHHSSHNHVYTLFNNFDTIYHTITPTIYQLLSFTSLASASSHIRSFRPICPTPPWHLETSREAHAAATLFDEVRPSCCGVHQTWIIRLTIIRILTAIGWTRTWFHRQFIIEVLQQKPEEWIKYLPLSVWADRVSVRRSTDYSAFDLLYVRDCLLSMDFTLESWSVIDWEEEIKTREDLIMTRMRQLDQKVLIEVQAAENLRNLRKANKIYYDHHKPLRSEAQQPHVGELVLVHRTKYSTSRSRVRQTWWSMVWTLSNSRNPRQLHILSSKNSTTRVNIYIRWQSPQTIFLSFWTRQ